MLSKCCVPFISALLLIISCSSDNPHNRNTLQKYNWIDFKWRTSEINGKFYDKAAILLPVRIDGYKSELIMQLDLGINRTIIFGNNLKGYPDLYEQLTNKIDTVGIKKANIEKGYPVKFIPDLPLTIADLDFKKLEVGIGYNLGELFHPDSVEYKKKSSMGLIGTDYFKNKIIIIDYKKECILIADTIYDDLVNLTDFHDCQSNKFGIVAIPITIDGNKKYYMFDTGSSIFTAILTTDLWKKYSDCQSQNTNMMEIMGIHKIKYIFEAEALKDAYLGDIKLPRSYYYCSPAEDAPFFNKVNISGIIGNAFFLDKIVIVDFKNKRFGIVKD